jgi:hypothetical protein
MEHERIEALTRSTEPMVALLALILLQLRGSRAMNAATPEAEPDPAPAATRKR